MTLLNSEMAKLVNAAVESAVLELGDSHTDDWPIVAEGQEIAVGWYGLQIIDSERTLNILQSPLFATGILEKLNVIVNPKASKKIKK